MKRLWFSFLLLVPLLVASCQHEVLLQAERPAMAALDFNRQEVTEVMLMDGLGNPLGNPQGPGSPTASELVVSLAPQNLDIELLALRGDQSLVAEGRLYHSQIAQNNSILHIFLRRPWVATGQGAQLVLSDPVALDGPEPDENPLSQG